MILKSKICGVSDSKTLNFVVNHQDPPQFIGFVVNYQKSKRYIDLEKLKKIITINKKNSFYVAVLVDPDEKILEEIKVLPFDYYQLYDCSVKKTQIIKNLYNKKIISAFTIKNFEDVEKFKLYKDVSDIYLFDSKGYEKSMSFDHTFIENIQFDKDVMLAGNIQINDDLEKYKKIADIIDISGGLETSGIKDISKIEIFLNKVKRLNYEN
jgi:phosphoribosylanthranilate isomerase